MRILSVVMLAIALVASTDDRVANAALSSGVLAGVSVDAKVNNSLPLSLMFSDDSGAPRTLGEALGGRPSVLIFADYTCRTLCGPILEFAVAGLEKSGLKPGADYRLVVVGIDPKDGVVGARAMRSSHIDAASPLAAATVLLTGDAVAINAATQAVGYHYVYDAEHDQFAHPAAAYVITPQGRIARVLSGLGLDGNDLRLALVDAGQGQIGTFIDHIRLLCYGFDPAQGIYTASIEWWLMAAAATTMIAMLAWIALLMRSSRGEAA
jgi:protein SCO1/2